MLSTDLNAELRCWTIPWYIQMCITKAVPWIHTFTVEELFKTSLSTAKFVFEFEHPIPAIELAGVAVSRPGTHNGHYYLKIASADRKRIQLFVKITWDVELITKYVGNLIRATSRFEILKCQISTTYSIKNSFIHLEIIYSEHVTQAVVYKEMCWYINTSDNICALWDTLYHIVLLQMAIDFRSELPGKQTNIHTQICKSCP